MPPAKQAGCVLAQLLTKYRAVDRGPLIIVKIGKPEYRGLLRCDCRTPGDIEVRGIDYVAEMHQPLAAQQVVIGGRLVPSMVAIQQIGELTQEVRLLRAEIF